MVAISLSITVSGFDDLKKKLDKGLRNTLIEVADRANRLMAIPTKTWDEKVVFVTRFSSRNRIVAGTDNARYAEVNDGFEHNTAFTLDFSPKTKVRELVAFRGSGQAFPGRRISPTNAEARKFDEETVVVLTPIVGAIASTEYRKALR